LASTFIPFYIISHRGTELDEIPLWGPMPLWVVVVIFGRELLITLFRSYAARLGVVIAAGQAGKQKALLQSIFSGGLLLLYPLRILAETRGWQDLLWWRTLGSFLGGLVASTLALALILTVYSMLDYLWRYRSVMGIRN
jgi:phosphatidylglycerophosphate synthase